MKRPEKESLINSKRQWLIVGSEPPITSHASRWESRRCKPLGIVITSQGFCYVVYIGEGVDQVAMQAANEIMATLITEWDEGLNSETDTF